MNQPEGQKGAIGISTAMVLFALLAAWSIATLRGTLLVVALVIIGGLAAKSYVHFVRARLKG